jgi:L-threonylcarbamoyladenylate synthase
MLPVHYAPRTPTVRADSAEQLERVTWPDRAALIIFGPSALPVLPAHLHIVQLREPEDAGTRLYEVLHACDSLNGEVIVILMPPEEPRWLTVRDRLIRAARPLLS